MAYTKSVLFYSLLATLISLPYDSGAAIRVSNKSRGYAASDDQVNAIRNPGPAVQMQSQPVAQTAPDAVAEPAITQVNLPIHVANAALGQQIANGQDAPVSIEQLEKCSAIYPNGEFEWNTPTVGNKRANGDQCVSIVEMRAYQQGENGSDLVVARVRLGAGDAIKCNISAWPESSYLQAAGQIEFPADAEPTLKDVEKQMNQEQKQNAGIKIAAGTILAAVAGNVIGKGEVGNEKLLGTNKEKLTTTAIGAATGAALMAGSVYGGKVAGDMILSAGVNAAAGGLIGNMVATGNEVLRVESCAAVSGTNTNAENNSDSNKNDTESARDRLCLWGMYAVTKESPENAVYYYDITDGDYYECIVTTNQQGEEESKCSIVELVGSQIIKSGTDTYKDMEEAKNANYIEVAKSYILNETDNKMEEFSGAPNASGNNHYVLVSGGKVVANKVPAVALLPEGTNNPAMGFKEKHWTEVKEKSMLYNRGVDGNPTTELKSKDGKQLTGVDSGFLVMDQSAEDGGLIDFNNKARLKATLIGAGSGAAMGAFVAYQGAKSDIQLRWEQEVRTYKDSLNRVYCATGNRFLSSYNDDAYIPESR